PLDAMVESIRVQPSHLNVYFVNESEVTYSATGPVYDTVDWAAGEIASATAAFDMYAQVANLTFSVVSDPALADFFMAISSPLPFGASGQAIPYATTGTVTIDGVPYAGVESIAFFDPTSAAWD